MFQLLVVQGRIMFKESDHLNTSDGKIGSCIFEPKVWPSPIPEKGDFLRKV
jgi:hypothetical protein